MTGVVNTDYKRKNESRRKKFSTKEKHGLKQGLKKQIEDSQMKKQRHD
jgi:hypothetical protein